MILNEINKSAVSAFVLFAVFCLYISTAVASGDINSAASVNLNVAYQGEISTVGERDWYKFNVEPNHRYYIIVWADNTFGNNPDGLKDTQLRAYLNKGDPEHPDALNNTDAPVEMNLGYGSSIIVEAIPQDHSPTKMGHCVAPSTVVFFIEQQDLAPETGTYSFEIFVDDMPVNADGTYDYDAPMTDSLLSGPVNPPSSTIPAPEANSNPQTISLIVSENIGNAPFTVYPKVYLNGSDITYLCDFSYGDSDYEQWTSSTSHEYQNEGTYSITAKYIDDGSTVTSDPVSIIVNKQIDVHDIEFQLKAIDIADELVLKGNNGIHVYVWVGGDSEEQPVDQFFALMVNDVWYTIDENSQWNLLDINSPDLIDHLPVWKTAPLSSNKEIILSIPDFMLPYNDEIDCIFCIDNEPDGKFTMDKSACKTLSIIHLPSD